METIAVYWEPVIRVYGFDIRTDLALLECDVQPEAADFWGERLESLALTGSGFIMVLMQSRDHATARLSLVIEQEYADSCRRLLEECRHDGYRISIRLRQPVDMLLFHGPHFQDRYGIAEAVFRSLDQTRISLYAVGCTGTSVYIVVGGGEAGPARTMLSAGFVVPGQESCAGTA